MSREQDSVAAEVEQIARAMYYFGDWDTYAVEAQKNYWRGKARLAIAALAALSHPQAASSTQAGDWYVSDEGSVCIDFDHDPKHQLSLMCQKDGQVRFAAYVNGATFTGNAMNPSDMAPVVQAMIASSTTPASGGTLICQSCLGRGKTEIPGVDTHGATAPCEACKGKGFTGTPPATRAPGSISNRTRATWMTCCSMA